MDYLEQIQIFNKLLPSSNITAYGINLWYGLMYIFSISGWQKKMSVTMDRIISQTKLSRYTITRERERLSQLGLIRYSRPSGYYHGCYEILPLSEEMLRQIEPTLLQGETKSAASATMSAVSATMSAVPATISENAYKVVHSNNNNSNIDIQRNKENTKRKKKVNPSVTDPANPAGKKEKSCAKKERKAATAFKQDVWLATLQEPWQGLMKQWLEYKAARKESYKTEVGARKCISLLQNLSGNSPQVAQLIIDQSIGNNYAGLFALRQQNTASRTQVPQTGQRIGQIKQPETEEKRQRLLERFAQAGQRTDSPAETKNGNNQ